ncbi:hypothetical protein ACGC1H_001751 [Rhizoctonia solani]
MARLYFNDEPVGSTYSLYASLDCDWTKPVSIQDSCQGSRKVVQYDCHCADGRVFNRIWSVLWGGCNATWLGRFYPPFRASCRDAKAWSPRVYVLNSTHVRISIEMKRYSGASMPR